MYADIRTEIKNRGLHFLRHCAVTRRVDHSLCGGYLFRMAWSFCRLPRGRMREEGREYTASKLSRRVYFFTCLTTRMDGCSSSIMNTDPTRLCWQAKLSLRPKLSLYLQFHSCSFVEGKVRVWSTDCFVVARRENMQPCTNTYSWLFGGQERPHDVSPSMLLP